MRRKKFDYSKVRNYFLNLCKDSSGAINSKKMNTIKSALKIFGAIATAIGFILFFVSALSFRRNDEISNMLGMLALLIIALPLTGFGIMAFNIGKGLTASGVTPQFLDKNNKCPKCGEIVDENKTVCNKCRADLKASKTCESCGTINEVKDEYCKNCWKKL